MRLKSTCLGLYRKMAGPSTTRHRDNVRKQWVCAYANGAKNAYCENIARYAWWDLKMTVIKVQQLGKALRTLRLQRQWSLDYVADMCQTSSPNLSKIERGQPKEFKLDLLSKLAAVYGLRTYELFALAEEIELTHLDALSLDEADFLDAYRSLSTGRRFVAKATIETMVQPLDFQIL